LSFKPLLSVLLDLFQELLIVVSLQNRCISVGAAFTREKLVMKQMERPRLVRFGEIGVESLTALHIATFLFALCCLQGKKTDGEEEEDWEEERWEGRKVLAVGRKAVAISFSSFTLFSATFGGKNQWYLQFGSFEDKVAGFCYLIQSFFGCLRA